MAGMRWVAALALAAVLGTGAALTPTAGAQAASPELLVSTDGTHFSPALSTNLFDDIALIVPGDVIQSHLWVRNASSSTALFRVAVGDLVVPSPAFGAAVTLSSAVGSVGRAATLSSLNRCQVIVDPMNLQAGDTIRIDFELQMNPATSGSDAQAETAALGFLVTGHDIAAGQFPNDDGCTSFVTGDAGSGGKLPFTGAGELTTALLVAVGLLGGGALLAFLRRRRRDDEVQES